MILRSCGVYAFSAFKAKCVLDDFGEYKIYSTPTNKFIKMPKRLRDRSQLFLDQSAKTGIIVSPYWNYAWIYNGKYFYLHNKNLLIDIGKLLAVKLNINLARMTKLKAEEYLKTIKLDWKPIQNI